MMHTQFTVSNNFIIRWLQFYRIKNIKKPPEMNTNYSCNHHIKACQIDNSINTKGGVELYRNIFRSFIIVDCKMSGVGAKRIL